MSRASILAALFMALGLAPAAAQEGGGGLLSASLGYSMERGPIVGVGLTAPDVWGSGVDLRFSGAWDERGREVAAIARTGRDLTVFGRPANLRFALTNRVTDWDDDDYATSRTGLSAGLEFGLGAQGTARVSYFVYEDEISDIAAGTSAFIAAEQGTRLASGLAFGWGVTTIDNPVAPRSGLSLDTELRWAGLGGDAEWVAIALAGSYYLPVRSQGTLRLAGIAGAAEGLNGDALTITERAFLTPQLPRGFASRGIGPRDLATDTALGGERYAAVALEYAHDIGSLGRADLRGHGFLEAGSVWQLANTGGGVVDDSQNWRSALGVAISAQTQLGRFELYAAHPLDQEVYDETQSVGLSLNLDF